MIKKLTTEAEIEEVLKIGSYAFNVPVSAELEKDLGTYVHHTTNWGEMDGEQLTSQILVFPFFVNLFGETVKMAGIGNVATYPEYRGQGGIRRLFGAIFEELRADGTVLSYLAPFSQPFYRKFGYEVIFSNLESKVHRKEITQLPVEKRGQMKRVDVADLKWQEVIKSLYAETLAKDTGSVLREDWWWKRIFEIPAKRQFALCFDEGETPVGYIAYEMYPGEMRIREVCYTNAFAIRKIGTFVASHSGTFEHFYFSQPAFRHLRTLFAESRGVEQTLQEGMMVKIVSLDQFIQAYRFNETRNEEFTLAVIDEFSPWNQGTWRLKIVDGKGEITLLSTELEDADFSGTIQNWTQVFLGHSTLTNHCFLEKIKTVSQTKMTSLAELLPESHLGLHDYF